jgi:hypothetical protein
MQRFLSYVVQAPGEVLIEKHSLVLGSGTNVFSITVEDPAAFRKLLTDAGCVVLREHYLDALEAVPSEVVKTTIPEIAASRRGLQGGN